ncbi:4'-phosphopantetheinyl transferase family protein [Streptomyces sp. NPDC020379]|uniref:4'-phosphopantetheinyl transferase family protein n=1 Tax=Streptomyces sp. NPDC020379 TaxID=3365071 RepID=UPI0037AEBA44
MSVPSPAVLLPVRLLTPSGPWEAVADDWAREGTVLAYGVVADWAPPSDAAAERLAADEPCRWAGLRGEGLRTRFLASRFLLRSLVGAVTGTGWRGVRPARTTTGRPYVRGLPGLRVSLSHSGPVLAAAVSGHGPVGVDTERAGRGTSLSPAHVCTAEEAERLAGLRDDERAAELLRLWTLKEAYTKALGVGLRRSPRGFGFAPGARGPVLLDEGEGEPDPYRQWSFATRLVRSALPEPYLLSVAVAQPVESGRAAAPSARPASGRSPLRTA